MPALNQPAEALRPPPDEVIEWLGMKILTLPKAYAVQIESRWSRVQENLTTPMLKRFLQNFKAVCVSVSNTHGRGNYTHMMSFAVLDIDNIVAPNRAKIAALALSQKLDEWGVTYGVHHFIDFTGKKGFRIWIPFDKEVPENAIFAWLAEVCRQCGYFQKDNESFTEDPLLTTIERHWEASLMLPTISAELIQRLNFLRLDDTATIELIADFDMTSGTPPDAQMRVWNLKWSDKTYRLECSMSDSLISVYDDSANATTIDLLIAEQEGKVVKIPFSKHQDQEREGFYDIPIPRESIEDFDFERKPTQHDFDVAYRIILGINPISNEILKDFMECPRPVVRYIKKYHGGSVVSLDFEIPEDNKSLSKIMDKINDTPCLNVCYNRALTEHGVYWNRATIVHILAQIGVPTEDIASFMRYKVNDDTDNQHLDVLKQQVAYHMGKTAWGSCHFLKNGKEPCCPGNCGRDHPSDGPRPFKIFVPGITANPIEVVFRRIYESGVDTLVYGATRSHKTTEALLGAMAAGKRTVLVVPRISIILETVQRMLDIASQRNMRVKAAFVSDTREICLRVKRLVELKEEETENPAILDLKRWSKPACTDCKARIKVIGKDGVIIENVLYGSADTEQGYCGYQGIIQNDWDLLVMSNVKFWEILRSSLLGNISPINAKIQSSEVIIFDEISTLIETPHLVVPTDYVYKDGRRYRLYDAIHSEACALAAYVNSKLPAIMRHDTGKVNGKVLVLSEIMKWSRERIDAMEGAIEQWRAGGQTITMYRQILTRDQLEDAARFADAMQRSAEGLALDENVALNVLIDMADLQQEAEWIVVNVPTMDSPINVSVYIAPKAPDFSALLGAFHGQILCLDATPSIVPIDYALDRRFSVINIGAPFERELRHIIVPDLQPVYASGIERHLGYLDNMIHWANKIDVLHDHKFLTTSKRLNDLITQRTTAQTMWHRGTQVMGVPCAQRFGIALSSPNAPHDAMNWLRFSYENALRNISDRQLHQHEQTRQTVQAEGRFKDPHNREYSAVFSFGQTHSDCTANYMNAIAPQRILVNPSKNGAPPIPTTTCPVPLLQAAIWMQFHEVVEGRTDVWLLDAITKGQPPKKPNQKARYDYLNGLVDRIVDLTPRPAADPADVAALTDILRNLPDIPDAPDT